MVSLIISLSICCNHKQKSLCDRRSNIRFLQGSTYWCCCSGRDRSHHCCSYMVGWTNIAGNSWPTCLRPVFIIMFQNCLFTFMSDIISYLFTSCLSWCYRAIFVFFLFPVQCITSCIIFQYVVFSRSFSWSTHTHLILCVSGMLPLSILWHPLAFIVIIIIIYWFLTWSFLVLSIIRCSIFYYTIIYATFPPFFQETYKEWPQMSLHILWDISIAPDKTSSVATW